MHKLIALAGIAAALVSISLCQPAQADAPEDDSGLRQNCVGDYFRYCSGYMPGTKAIRECFAQNIAQLTPECRGAIHAFDRRNPK